MVFGLGLLVNAVLVAIPIGGSVGTLMGIDAHRAATGQKPLFSGHNEDSIGHGGGGGGSDSTGDGGNHPGTSGDGIQIKQYCDKSWGITPPSKTEQYTLNPNQWGVTSDTTGNGLCMNVTTFNNQTYAPQTAPQFTITWQFDQGPENAPVHGYPNIRVDDVLPKALDEISELNLDLHWTYGLGDEPAESTDVQTLKDENLSTNVAIDMFLDSDAEIAKNGSNAKFEVMVWFWMSSETAQPHGWGKPVIKRNVEGTTFTLYTGANEHQQQVLSWVTENMTERFTGDIYPLITDLYNLPGDNYPAKNDYLGSLSFGTEAYSVDKNVTFWADEYKIDIKTLG
ncbi:Glycoside hydrolase family 12 [Penicillium bovifimosum]|uniref:xyloglucan-specific endo-beta-1,4-glucanase n=1 Tax=Penicillium bovifimosum TaxID=126998 RepID=A0A9W9KXZ3_9EURO|nr:Glycoside hydrolase family 12 [Penicillium bovifimosum]KAJ5124763.1 Glycoside hydrolase family 12 [Penicillium bovifimosum]